MAEERLFLEPSKMASYEIQNKRKAKSLRQQGRSLQVTCWQPLTWRCPQPLGSHCHLSMASEGVGVLVHPGKPSYCSCVHLLHDAVCIWPTSLPKPHHPSSDTRNKRGQGLTLRDCFPPRLLSLSHPQGLSYFRSEPTLCHKSKPQQLSKLQNSYAHSARHPWEHCPCTPSAPQIVLWLEKGMVIKPRPSDLGAGSSLQSHARSIAPAASHHCALCTWHLLPSEKSVVISPSSSLETLLKYVCSSFYFVSVHLLSNLLTNIQTGHFDCHSHV